MDINCHILRFRKADTCPRPTDEQWRQDLKQGLLMLKATLSPPYQLPGSILWGGSLHTDRLFRADTHRASSHSFPEQPSDP